MAGPASDLKHYISTEMVGEIESFKNNTGFKYEITKEVFCAMTQTR